MILFKPKKTPCILAKMKFREFNFDLLLVFLEFSLNY